MSGRSFSDVFQDIVRDIHEIIRAEFRLAKAELRDEASQASASIAIMAAGAFAAAFALQFLFWAITFALALVMPMWAATLIVTAALGISGAVLLSVGRYRFRRTQVTPIRTVATFKENVEWVRQSIK